MGEGVLGGAQIVDQSKGIGGEVGWNKGWNKELKKVKSKERH